VQDDAFFLFNMANNLMSLSQLSVSVTKCNVMLFLIFLFRNIL